MQPSFPVNYNGSAAGRMGTAMNWWETVSDKLISPAEAPRAVKSGDVAAIAAINCTPFTLCHALYERRAGLSGVRIDHPAPLFPRAQEGDEGAFTLHYLYATPADRQMVNAGRVEYCPAARWKTGLPLMVSRSVLTCICCRSRRRTSTAIAASGQACSSRPAVRSGSAHRSPSGRSPLRRGKPGDGSNRHPGICGTD